MILFFIALGLCLAHESIFFDDDVLFGINFESASELGHTGYDHDSLLKVVTAEDEHYSCMLPKVTSQTPSKMDSYYGPHPGELVTGIYTDNSCLLRVDMYWSYELCHGKYVRQFHDEKDTKYVAEFYLGNYVEKQNSENEVDPLNPPTRDFHGRTQAYYPVTYKHGTTCDLTGQPRVTTVMYICTEAGDVFYSLNEVSTCVYEAVVGINELCTHPMFKTQTPAEHSIRCFAHESQRNKDPRALRVFQAEVSRKPMLPTRVGHGPITQTMPKQTLAEDIFNLFQSPDASALEKVKKLLDKQIQSAKKAAPQQNLLDDFWSGRACLYGGTGWWKYEFCYGQSVAQFHEENGKTTKIVLGYFNEQVHREWAENPPQKARKVVEGHVYQVSMFYSKGDVCHEINGLRSCEVRLTCRQGGEFAAKDRITMYLIEPETCLYVLVVESPLFCDVLQKSGEDGLLPAHNELDDAEVKLPDGDVFEVNLKYDESKTLTTKNKPPRAKKKHIEL